MELHIRVFIVTYEVVQNVTKILDMVNYIGEVAFVYEN